MSEKYYDAEAKLKSLQLLCDVQKSLIDRYKKVLEEILELKKNEYNVSANSYRYYEMLKIAEQALANENINSKQEGE